jgi:hypothetical protein
MQNIANSEAGRTSWHPFLPTVTENSGGDGFLGGGLYQHALYFKPKNHHYESLLGPYECKLQ